MKIVLRILAIAAIVALGVTTILFYNKNKNQLKENASLQAQTASIQAQLDAIGSLATVYEVANPVASGQEIKEGDLIEVTVPASTLGNVGITDKTLLVGNHYRLNLNPGTVLTSDLLMDEDQQNYKFHIDLTLTSLPIDTKVGDYIDIRMLLPDGEEIPVLTHKKVVGLWNNTISFKATEEENQIYLSMLQDMGQHQSTSIFYATKYIEPGNQDTVAYYPVSHELESAVRFNPNITDPSRCINSTFRDHIDEVMLTFSDSANTAMSSAWINAVNTQLSGQIAARSMWQTEQNEEGASDAEENEDTGSESLEQQSADAADSITEDADKMSEGSGDEEAID